MWDARNDFSSRTLLLEWGSKILQLCLPLLGCKHNVLFTKALKDRYYDIHYFEQKQESQSHPTISDVAIRHSLKFTITLQYCAGQVCESNNFETQKIATILSNTMQQPLQLLFSSKQYVLKYNKYLYQTLRIAADRWRHDLFITKIIQKIWAKLKWLLWSKRYVQTTNVIWAQLLAVH